MFLIIKLNFLQMLNGTLMFLLCTIGVILLIVYYIFVRKPLRKSYSQPSQIRRNRQARGDDECCICLSEQKKFEVSITCGHSFCGNCLLNLFNHTNQKIKCPLCRDEVNVIFKVFHNELPQEQARRLQQKIREYNHKFDDDRPFLRRASEFPFILTALSDRLFTMDFIRYFFSTTNLFKMTLTMLIYFISPIDLLPELLLGAAGYADDVGFFIVVFLYTVANSAVQYVRNRQ